MRMRSLRLLMSSIAPVSLFALIGSDANAQFNNQWIEFTNSTASRLAVTPTSISDNSIEIDFAYGDLDKDGRIDLVVARKQNFTTSGKRPNLLLMNENGVLVDRTAQYASAADVPGDQGFLTPTNNRDIRVADVTGDGWLDVITSPVIALAGDPKHVSHPRIYRNLGKNGNGDWLGLKFENSRIPQLLVNGSPAPANGCGIAVGNMAGDPSPDLYIVDYDNFDLPNLDTQDRLLVNDGNGFFTDQSALVAGNMSNSGFGTSGHVADFNGDGFGDVVKAMAGPTILAYGSASGAHTLIQEPYSGAAYNVDAGDLNNDGKVDLIVSDDGLDRFLLNKGNDALNRVIWSTAFTYNFISGGDDGIGGNTRIADMNGDGFAEALHADVDVDIPGCGNRLHVYHNQAGAPGSNVILREERENTTGTSWLGAKGLKQADLQGTYDTAVFDIDNDGDQDLIIGRCTGTYVYENTATVNICQPTFLGASKGDGHMTVCGQPLQTGGVATMTLTGGPNNGIALILAGLSNTTQSALGGTVLLPFALAVTIPLGPNGGSALPIPGGGGTVGGLNFYAQALLAAPAGSTPTDITEIVRMVFLP